MNSTKLILFILVLLCIHFGRDVRADIPPPTPDPVPSPHGWAQPQPMPSFGFDPYWSMRYRYWMMSRNWYQPYPPYSPYWYYYGLYHPSRRRFINYTPGYPTLLDDSDTRVIHRKTRANQNDQGTTDGPLPHQ